jgi:triacylglycerol esterase/lipase EstA (alpha/beta hydrolase family)
MRNNAGRKKAARTSHNADPANHATAPAQSIKAPSLALLALELRAYWEFGAGLISLPFLQLAAKGDHHPVLVFPGLGAGNYSTLLLRQFLKNHKYSSYPWRLNRNFGPRPGVLKTCLEHIEDLHNWHGKKISLIGWSLGGFYARELAKAMPEKVRCVITLGTPFAGPPKANHAWHFYEWITGEKVDELNYNTILSEPPPVPTTSIYSKSDGIVSWKCCIQEQRPATENIEVWASHLGMGANPLTLFVIADRLAQPDGHWQPFELAKLFKLCQR